MSQTLESRLKLYRSQLGDLPANVLSIKALGFRANKSSAFAQPSAHNE